MYSRILVPVDLEHVDKLTKALELAGKTAKQHGATLDYVDVVDAIPTTSPLPVGHSVADRLRKFAEAQARAYGISVDECVTLRSDLRINVGSDVVKAAEDEGCDLIIMASHIPGIKDHFLISNAGYVAAHAPISVFVIR